MKVRTVKLQEMLSKVVKGASNNKLIPLTSMLLIKAGSGELCLSTTDASNYLYVRDAGETTDNFYAVVDINLFNNLINKFTSEFTELVLGDNVLQVVGNGTYLLNLQFDDNGKVVRFPQPQIESTNRVVEKEITSATIDTILKSNKVSLATTLEIPVYTGYYIGDRVISTDTTKICELKASLFETPVLMSREFMDLVGLIDDETIKFRISGNEVEAHGKMVSVYGHLMSGVEEYRVAAIDGLLDQEFESCCTIKRNDLIRVLERINLFIDTYDNGSIKLMFKKDSLDIRSLKSNGIETLPYSGSMKAVEFTALISAAMLLEQVKAGNTPTIDIYYGFDNAIKIVDDNVVQIVALSQE